MSLRPDLRSLVNATESLTKMAEGIKLDLAEQAAGQDLSYDIYVEKLRDDKGVRCWVGLINFGDLFQAVYEWNGRSWEQTVRFGAPFEVEERIFRARMVHPEVPRGPA